MRHRNAVLAVVVVVALGVVTTGPSALAQAPPEETSVEYELTVTDHGEFDRFELRWEVDAATYDEMAAFAIDDEHESVAEWLATDMVQASDDLLAYGETADTERTDSYVIEIEFTDVATDVVGTADVRADNGTVDLSLERVRDPEGTDGPGNVTVVVDMPGEIYESNADDVDDSVATWTLDEEAPTALSVESVQSDDGLPGFGISPAVAGLLGAVFLLARRYR